MNAKYCPVCDPKDAIGVKHISFCTKCGDKLVEMPPRPRCSFCGAELLEHHNFCGWCGRDRETGLKKHSDPTQNIHDSTQNELSDASRIDESTKLGSD